MIRLDISALEATKGSNSTPIHTRYASNKEWTRPTYITVQAPVNSHFHEDETNRLKYAPFVDNVSINQRERYKLKISHFVRDKNINSLGELLKA